jgi:hypothetical protein
MSPVLNSYLARRCRRSVPAATAGTHHTGRKASGGIRPLLAASQWIERPTALTCGLTSEDTR